MEQSARRPKSEPSSSLRHKAACNFFEVSSRAMSFKDSLVISKRLGELRELVKRDGTRRLCLKVRARPGASSTGQCHRHNQEMAPVSGQGLWPFIPYEVAYLAGPCNHCMSLRLGHLVRVTEVTEKMCSPREATHSPRPVG